MGKINAGRVVAGGIAAGVIINLGEWIASILFQEQYEAMYEAMGIPEPSGAALAVFGVFTLLMGIVVVWLYAAMRPRFGPGPRTAVFAGLVMWLLAWLWPTSSMVAMGALGMTTGMFIVAMIWGVVEVLVAAMVGGWLYKESEAPAIPTAA